VKQPYRNTAITMLCLTLLVQFYFATLFNESVRNPFDLLAMLFIAPGFLINFFLNLRLPFDGANHGIIIWISGFIYTAIILGRMAIVQKGKNIKVNTRIQRGRLKGALSDVYKNINKYIKVGSKE
jgi:hypothetical protein